MTRAIGTRYVRCSHSRRPVAPQKYAWRLSISDMRARIDAHRNRQRAVVEGREASERGAGCMAAQHMAVQRRTAHP